MLYYPGAPVGPAFGLDRKGRADMIPPGAHGRMAPAADKQCGRGG
jgi:hypothetical protein